MSTITIRPMIDGDAAMISRAFTDIGWDKPILLFDGYLSDQRSGDRRAFVAEVDGAFAGYGTVLWKSGYSPFAEAGIPEIVDLNILPRFRRLSAASRLMDEAEAVIRTRSNVAGIGVGLYADYGAAQRMYILRGYVPDGRGVTAGDAVPEPGSTVCLDDALVLHLTKVLG